MFDTKQMTEMAEKMATLYKTTGMDPQKFFEGFQKLVPAELPELPKVNYNKNGYEIRTKILEMAQNNVWQDYHAKYGAWETSVNKENNEVVVKVELPEVPGAEAVLEAAEKFYAFVNQK